jgi:hypothetical protein
MTCWRRLRDWQTAGVWDRLHALLLAELHAADRIDWSRAVADSWKPSHQYEASPVGFGVAPRRSTPIGAMTTTSTGGWCVVVGSGRGSAGAP